MTKDERQDNPIAGAWADAECLGPPDHPDDRTDPLATDCAVFLQNDLGNSERFRRRFGDELIYIKDVGWHYFDGRMWSARDGSKMAKIFAQKTAMAIRHEGRILQDQGQIGDESFKEFQERVKKRYGWRIQSGNSNKLSAMVREAEPHLMKSVKDLDTHKFYLNVGNGTLELNGDVTLRPHDRGDFITKICPVDYDPDAICPRFRAFLDDILPNDVQNYVQRWFGYSLTADVSEQCLIFFYGTGANGKSTLVELMAWLLGDYSMTLDFASLQVDDRRRGSEASPDIARLPGARMVSCAEPERGKAMAEGLIKSLTGGDEMTARHLNQDFFDFKPEFKLVLSFNEKPQIKGNDNGIWRRINLVPFDAHIAEADRDRNLKEKIIREEGPGILNWALDGYRMWREQGLNPPDIILDKTKEYRTDSDPVGQFLEGCIIVSPGGIVTAKEMYDLYVRWCRANSQVWWKQTAFGRAVMAHRVGGQPLEKGKSGVVYYKNVAMVDDLPFVDVDEGLPEEVG